VIGDNAQTGDVRSGDSAGGNITHNDLDQIARLLQYFTDSLEVQREADRRERLDRQREIDTYTLGVRGSIEALRGEQAKVREQLTALTTTVATITETVGRIQRRTAYTPHMTALLLILIVVVGAMLWRLWPTIYALALAGL